MPEQRQHIRQKSLLRGLVYFDGQPFAVECVVRDISETGARLAFSQAPAGSAHQLELQIPLKAQRHRCRIVWRADNELGLAFLDAVAADADPKAMAQQIARLEAEIEELRGIVRRLRTDAAAGAA